MLDNNGCRMLAYVQEVSSIEPLFFCKTITNAAGVKEFVPDLDDEGNMVYADSIEKAHVLGWTLVIKKGEFKPGDKCVFFEIDSKVPRGKFLTPDGVDIFAFLDNKNYCVKTYKLNKFGVWSQGLILPLESFGIDPETPVNTNLTSVIGVVYATPEDNDRKSDPQKDAEKKYQAKHKKFFNNPIVKKLMQFKFFRKIFLLGLKKNKKKSRSAFPTEFVSKTDEERIQNIPWVLKDKTPLVATEKIDGTSTTWLMVRTSKRKFDFYVCSRNVRMQTPDQPCFGKNANIYWENAIKYDIENQFKKYLLAHPKLRWICIQGESYGEGWQSNPLKMEGHHFATFNLKDSKNGRWGSLQAKEELSHWDTPIPWVPIISTEFVLPDTVEELLDIATAKSAINPNVLREGIVFRSLDGQVSFKAVSPEYLMKHNI